MPDRPEKIKGKLYVKCPICKTVMNRKLFGAGAGVIVDVCRSHGTFFDVGELPVIITYVQEGGLEKHAKKEIERMRDDAKREQRNAALAQAITASRVEGPTFPVSSSRYTSASRGGMLVDLLEALFR